MGFLGKIFKKKKKSDDDFDDDFDLDEDDDDEAEDRREGGDSASEDDDEMGDFGGDDDDDDFDEFDDEFDEDGSGKKRGSKKKLVLIATSAIVLVAALGGGSYWLFFTEETPEDTTSAQAVGAAVGLALTQQATSGLTPGGVTGGGKLSAPTPGAATTGSPGKLGAPAPSAGGKLGAPSTGAKLSASQAATVSSMVTGGMGGFDPNNPAAPLSTAAVADVGINIPAVLPQKMAALGSPVPAQPLAPANDPALLEETENGILPTVSPDGTQPWISYARPLSADPNQPAISLVVSGLGLSATLTQAAIDHLPADVTLSFSPYGSDLGIWVQKARAAGHEVLMELPLESESFPADDPGPLSIKRGQSVGEKIEIMTKIMTQAQGYIGFLGTFGSALTKDERSMNTLLKEMKTRGLFYLDPRAASNTVSLMAADQLQVPRAISDMQVDVEGPSQRVRAQLETLSTIARNQGLSVGLMPVSPNGILAVKQWAESLQGGVLAPVSSAAGRQQS